MTTTYRVALITGGSRGIGAATARLLAAHGNRVIINYRQNAEAAETELSLRTEEARQRIASMTPLRRLAQPEDVARVIAFLSSEESGFVTGTYAPVNGGMNMD